MKRAITLSILFVFVSVSLVFAQGASMVFVSWGITVPMAPEELNIFWQPSYTNFTGGIGFTPIENMDVYLSMAYQRFLFDKNKGFSVQEIGPVNRIAVIKTLDGTLNAKYSVPLPFFGLVEGLKFYGVGGVGLIRLIPISYMQFNTKIDFTSPGLPPDALLFQNNDSWYATGEKAFAPLVNVGVGLAHDEEDGTFFLEVRYMGAFPKGQKTNYFLPIKAGWIFKIK